MAKRRGTVFVRANRESQSDGKAKVHTHAIELDRAMGQAKTLLFHGRVYARSGNGRVTFKLFQSSLSGVRPREDGIDLAVTGATALTAVGPFSFTATGDFMAAVECTADVDASAGSAKENVEFSLDVTIIDA